MRNKLRRLVIITILAFGSGTLAHATYHYRYVLPAPEKTVLNGKASWYSRRDPGIRERTANNEIFDDTKMTCAMWGVPFNQLIKVTNIENGKSITVRVNDRGPHKRYVEKGRIIDLTKNAFRQIAPLHKGLVNIKLEML